SPGDGRAAKPDSRHPRRRYPPVARRTCGTDTFRLAADSGSIAAPARGFDLRPADGRNVALHARMKPLVLTHFTAASCLGLGVATTLEALRERRSGLRPCTFETADLPTYAGEVAGVDAVVLPDPLRQFDCRNNRLALLAMQQDGFLRAVEES